MAALTTLFPVFFMLALGFISRKKGWVTLEQKNGANVIVFQILFPILIFNFMCSAQIEVSHIKMIVYVFIMFILAWVVGKCLSSWTGKNMLIFHHIY